MLGCADQVSNNRLACCCIVSVSCLCSFSNVYNSWVHILFSAVLPNTFVNIPQSMMGYSNADIDALDQKDRQAFPNCWACSPASVSFVCLLILCGCTTVHVCSKRGMQADIAAPYPLDFWALPQWSACPPASVGVFCTAGGAASMGR